MLYPYSTNFKFKFPISLQNLKPELIAYENIFTSHSIVGIDFLSPGE